MNTYWFRVRDGAAGRAVVLLDASAAAAPFRPAQRDLLARLADAVPATDLPDVGFLGSAARVPFARFAREADGLFAANAGRGRVIAPLLDTFRADWPHRVVACAARPPVDLADWRDAPAAGRLVLVRFDPEGPPTGGACPELPPDPAAVAGVLVRRPVAVRVRLPGGFPVAWDNPAYRVEAGGLVAAGAAAPEVRVGFLHPGDPPPPEAVREWADGPADPLPVGPDAPDPEPAWLPLTGIEHGALEAWRDGRSARCGACGGPHPPGAVACPGGGGSLFPSLAREPAGGFVRVQVGMDEARYQPTGGAAVPVGGGAVVARDGERFAVWRFDEPGGEWVKAAEPWGAFEPAGPADEYLLALPGGPA